VITSRDRYFRIPYAPGGYAYLRRAKRSDGSGELVAIGSEITDTVQLNSEGTPLRMEGGIITFYLDPGITEFGTCAAILQVIGAYDTGRVTKAGTLTLAKWDVDLSRLREISYQQFKAEMRAAADANALVTWKEIDYQHAKLIRRKFEWISRNRHVFDDVARAQGLLAEYEFEGNDCLVYRTGRGNWHAIWVPNRSEYGTTYQMDAVHDGYSSKTSLLERMKRRGPRN
jgi:hypothetical protein